MSALVSIDDAQKILAAAAPAATVERAALDAALGRRLAEPVIATVDRPPADVSAMDGYAVRLVDVRNAGASLRIVGESRAGAPSAATISSGEAVRIFTGASVPPGADHIVMQEDAARDGDCVTIFRGHDKARHVRPAGMDFRSGEELAPVGAVIGPSELAAAAAGNLATLGVRRRLRVGILANGDELRPPGTTLAPGQIVNSNPVALAGLIASWGGEAVDLGVAADSLDSIRTHINRAKSIDILLPVGGASVGDHDLMRPAFAAEGFEPLFAKVAIRPGKPTWLSRRGAQIALGLPGNPASAFVCAHIFLRPLLTGDATPFRRARLAAALDAEGSRDSLLRATARIDNNGAVLVTPSDNQDSSLIRPFLSANALVLRRANAPAAAVGDRVDMTLIGPI
ncbi:MAG: molybdopterin molybdenumtransferase MoeA [Alphaproteobacteria bacterium]|nr:molybdopterin molybdenumtransferase MoeA [Alphaproteobacteria bacterium]